MSYPAHGLSYFRRIALVVAALVAMAAISRGQQSSVGVNLSGDWLWADAMRQARSQWDTATGLGDGQGTADANDWPTEDVSLVVWEGHAFNDGTYALTYNGKATVAVSLGYGKVNGAASSAGTYNASTNTTSSTVVITDTGFENCSLIFTNTQRTATSGTNTGITNVHLYRPISEGSSTSYPATTLFTNQTIALSADFSATRFMDLLGTNDSAEMNWSDRVLPGVWNQNTMAYEYVVAYGNATNEDIYINVPLYATSAYVTNLANLIKYGSDGVNPYTSAQANPVYAPLKPNLHVYLEYSNEVWNGRFDQLQEDYNIVVADQAANNTEWSVINFDGGAASNLWGGAWRRIAYQAKLISDAFRAVYGDAAMPPNADATVRPLFEFQAGDGQLTGMSGLECLDAYFNNSDGVAHVPNPHPMNYFFWGAGGAGYYNSNDDTADTVDDIFASGIPGSGYAATVQADSAVAKGYGLHRVAYEGGWSIYNGTDYWVSTPGTAAAVAKYDPRAASAETGAHEIFQQSGGDLEMLFQSSNWAPNGVWGLTDEVFNLTTPLMLGVTTIDASSAPAVTYGDPISSSTATTLAYASNTFSYDSFSTWVNDDSVIGFNPIVSQAGNYQLSLMVSATSAGRYLRVLVDGQPAGNNPIAVPVSGSATAVNVCTFNLTAGQHGLIVEGQYASNHNYSATECSFYSAILTPVAQLTYSQWSALYFTAQQLSQQTVSGLSAIPQHDNISNLEKYVLDINPARTMQLSDFGALGAGGITTYNGALCQTLTYRENPAITGITVNVQTSPDLKTWTTVTPSFTRNIGTDTSTLDPIIEVGAPTNGASQFLRLQVSSP